MATVVLGPLTPRFAIFNPSRASTLLVIIEKLWFALCATYCVDRLYRAYQVTHHAPSSLLDSDLKLVKCKALLNEFNEKKDLALLSACETLLGSISDKKNLEKQGILLDLVKYHSSQNPDRAYEFAQQLTSAHALLDAAEQIKKDHPTFDTEKLASLLVRAYVTRPSTELSIPHLDFSFYLKMAKAFYSLGKMDLRDQAFAKATAILPSLNLVTSFCETARCCQEIGVQEKVDGYLAEAEKLCTGDSISAYLTLANTFFFLSKFDKMDEIIDKLIKHLSNSNNIIIKTQKLPQLAKLLDEIRANNTCTSKHKTFFQGAFILDIFNFVQDPSDKTPTGRAEAYLNLAETYQSLGNEPRVNEATSLAFKEIEKVVRDPQISIATKESLLLVAFSYKNVPDTFFDLVKPFERLRELPFRMQGNTLTLYNEKMKGQARHQAWFEGYFKRITDAKATAYDKIKELTKGIDQNSFTPEQTKTLLETAEQLLPQVDPLFRALATADVAQGYLQVDRQKSYQLLDAYESWVVTRKRTRLLTTAVATLVFMGISWAYPRTIPGLASAFGLMQSLLYCR